MNLSIFAAALLLAQPHHDPGTASPMASAILSPAREGKISPGATGPLVVRVQILLDRARFSPGEIDGAYGEDLGIAVKGFQEKHDLKPTGIVDAATWHLLEVDTGNLLVPYTITAPDERGPFEKLPKDVHEQAKLKSMAYESPGEELGERFHISPQLLERLNPGKDITKSGELLLVPNVRRHAPSRMAVKVVVSKSKRTVMALGPQDVVLAQYPATIGGPHDPLPIGEWKIASLLPHPWFVWNAERFWNVDRGKGTVTLPPGPNNPAGLVWTGLSKEHYGIHGSPVPGAIRHESSYGCIRLTNWDAEDLSHMVRRGTPASLIE
jgi:lipoprotein-anchoring transpeptidase ErfK/SrfK